MMGKNPMSNQQCEWCGKSVQPLREHSVEECDGQQEWIHWLDNLEQQNPFTDWR